ncbi:MAG: SDR family NAD(P)-dependent oxidoreductase [Novosphingobium sp.]|nr:SDR family NAD(P)-dependent oxidoreductase [Novosphingobium sp.]
MDRLKDKVILIAGAGGIGNACAKRLASEGAAVVLGDIEADVARTCADQITQAGGKAVGLELDGSEEESIASAVETALSKFGGLDGLHANFLQPNEGDTLDVLGIPMAEWEEVTRGQQRGYVLCSRLGLPPMLERGGGSIIYTVSDAVYMAEPVRVGYAMAKAAITALMRHVAKRFGHEGIRANAIAPGLIVHDKVEAMMPPEFLEASRLATVTGRLGRPEDIAGVAAMLMSEDGRHVTGQVMSVNGGTMMRA